MLPEQVLNSESVNTVAKKLWPTMLFIIVMSIVSLIGLFFFKDHLTPASITFALITWFIAMLLITGFATYVFILDARVQLLGTKKITRKKKS